MVFSLLFAAPTMLMRFFSDDHILLSICKAETEGGRDGSDHTRYLASRRDAFGLVSLYSFATGTPEDRRAAIASGFVPWWSVEGVKLNFFRPISSYLGLLDYVLFGDRPSPYHMHSVLWFLAMILAWWLVLKRVLPSPVAVLALFLFLLDESHIFPVAWIANRHSLIAGTFGLLGLAAHLRWCQAGWRPGWVLSMVMFALAFMSGEMALGIMAYVLAHALLWDGRKPPDESADQPNGVPSPTWQWRLVHALPVVAVTATWACVYKQNGFGGRGMGSYIDPTSDPGTYLLESVPRAAVLLGNILGGPVGETATVIPGSLSVLIVLGVLLVGGAVVWLRHAWGGLSRAERSLLRWLIPGAICSMAPTLAVDQMSRHTLVAALGGTVVLAVLIRSAWRSRSEREGASRATRVLATVAAALAIWHVAVIPVASRLAAFGIMEGASRQCSRHVKEAGALLAGQEDPAKCNVIMLNSPRPFATHYLAFEAYHMDMPFPKSWHYFPLSRDALVVRRSTERELQLVVEGRAFLTPAIQTLARPPRVPLKVGYTEDCGAFAVRIDALSDRHEPIKTRLRFTGSPEDISLVLLLWEDAGPRIVSVPTVGTSVTLDVGRPWHALLPE
jgi:hypothetical protein